MTPTPLSLFLAENEIKLVHLARASRLSRQHIYRINTGRMEPTRPVMVWLAEATSQIVRRRVEVSELFDVPVGESVR
jgi:hypothetical protein